MEHVVACRLGESAGLTVQPTLLSVVASTRYVRADAVSPSTGAVQLMTASAPLSSAPERLTSKFNGWPGVLAVVVPPVWMLQPLPGFGLADVERVRKLYASSEPNE